MINYTNNIPQSKSNFCLLLLLNVKAHLGIVRLLSESDKHATSFGYATDLNLREPE